jgi:hypothetical protein
MENYGRKASAYLPTLNIAGMTDPVVQVIDEVMDEIVYTLRIQGSSFRPKVFREGKYTIVVGEPGTKNMKRLEHVTVIGPDNTGSISVDF